MRRGRSGVGLDAEQLALHVLGRDRRRVEDDERTVGARRMGVDQPRRQLLAGPGGPEISTRELAGPSRSMTRLQVGDRRRGADHAVDRAGARAQVVDLALQPRGLQRPLGDQDQAIGLERLFDEIVGAELDRGDRGLDVAVAGDHHHRHVRVLLLDRSPAAAGRRAASPAARCRAAPDAAGAPRSRRAPRRNCAPGACACPSSERMPETSSRMSSSSSTIRISAGIRIDLAVCGGIGGGGRRGARPAPATARSGSFISTCAP